MKTSRALQIPGKSAALTVRGAYAAQRHPTAVIPAAIPAPTTAIPIKTATNLKLPETGSPLAKIPAGAVMAAETGPAMAIIQAVTIPAAVIMEIAAGTPAMITAVETGIIIRIPEESILPSPRPQPLSSLHLQTSS